MFFCVTDYTGKYVYKNGNLEFFNHAEGYVEKEADGYKYVYQFKDHLGNVRLSYKDADNNGLISQSEIVQEKNYYPFGLQHKGYNNIVRGSENKHFTYVGKEQNESLDYNMLEMDWRHYDPATGRFVTIDAMAESFTDLTPYHYSDNNPIMYGDPTGLFPENHATWVVNGETNERFWVDDGYDFDWIVSTDTFNTIKGAGEIPNNLKWERTKAFWKQVWEGVVNSNGSVEDEATAFFITDNLKDGVETIDQLSNGQYAAAALGMAMIPVNKLKKLKKLKKWIKKNDGKVPGTKKGNVTFKNREGKLPKTDADGNPVTYKEYDVNPTAAGQRRDAERLVKSSDGKVYYTSDHYGSFTEIED